MLQIRAFSPLGQKEPYHLKYYQKTTTTTTKNTEHRVREEEEKGEMQR